MSKKVQGAGFKSAKFHRPTAMSIAMADAGIIPAAHLITQPVAVGVLRHRNDNRNIRPSVQVAL